MSHHSVLVKYFSGPLTRGSSVWPQVEPFAIFAKELSAKLPNDPQSWVALQNLLDAQSAAARAYKATAPASTAPAWSRQEGEARAYRTANPHLRRPAFEDDRFKSFVVSIDLPHHPESAVCLRCLQRSEDAVRRTQ